MKKILVPTDFSKTAQLAVDVATDIARKAGAELILLHVIEMPSTTSINITGEVDLSEAWEDKIFTLKLIERSKKQMSRLFDNLKDNGLRVKQEMRMGTPFYGMRDVITEHMVDLVVMGAEGRSKIEEMIIGSNTEKVIRHAKCPVLTVHKKPVTTDFKNIVYATSMAKDEKVFSGIIRCTQELYDSTVHLLKINTPGNFQRDVVTRNYMQDFARKLQLKKFTINIFNDLTEEEGIIYFCRRCQCRSYCNGDPWPDRFCPFAGWQYRGGRGLPLKTTGTHIHYKLEHHF